MRLLKGRKIFKFVVHDTPALCSPLKCLVVKKYLSSHSLHGDSNLPAEPVAPEENPGRSFCGPGLHLEQHDEPVRRLVLSQGGHCFPGNRVAVTFFLTTRVSYENTFSAVISSPYLHLLAGLDRRKRIFIRYGEPQAHGNSVVNKVLEVFLSGLPQPVERLY